MQARLKADEVRLFIATKVSQGHNVSAREIAQHFSTNYHKFSRSAVIGLCYRNNIKLPCEPKRPRENKINKAVRVLKKKYPDRFPITESDGVHILDSQEHHCRELVGKMTYCGKDIARGSYCADHARKNYIGAERV